MELSFRLIKITALCWLGATVLGCLPYIISGEIPNIINAFFESASGFSATGATVLGDIENHSKGILLWRSLTQWLGGIGFLVSMAILSQTRDKPSGASIPVKAVITLYVLFTCLEVILLLFGGLTFFESATHAFSTVSTGGFSLYSASAAHYNSLYIDAVFVLFMLVSAISFNLYYRLIRRRPSGFRAVSVDPEFKFFIAILLAAVTLISANLILSGTCNSAAGAIRYSAFQSVSILTTTGYLKSDISSWPLFSAMILFSLMIIGSCGSSPGGGLKVIRILTLLKLIGRGIIVRQQPNAVVPIKFALRTISADAASRVAGAFFLYISLVAAGSVLISIDNAGLTRSVSAVISALGNIGPMFCENGASLDYSGFSYHSKLLLSLLMLAGKLFFSYGTGKINAS